jgi:hypothetical protein
MISVPTAIILCAIIIGVAAFISAKAMFWGPIKYAVSRVRYPNKRPAYCMKRQQYGFQCEQRGWVRTRATRKGGRVQLVDNRRGWGI